VSTPPKADPVKVCPVCGEPFGRRRFNGRLEDRTRFLARQTCSQQCGNSRTEVTKGAHHWRARLHRGESCEECGTTEDLHVHHIDRNPANDAVENLATLCASCHLRLHWREDRDKRMAAIRTGGLLNQRSAGGNRSSVG
jgi:hypothetical protein